MTTVLDSSAGDLQQILERYWGYTSFRPLQREAMDAILGGRDSLVVLPTGGGKSLCFQAPALLANGLAVVVSPLISLMKDQVDTLVGNGVPAALLQQRARPRIERRRSQPACARGGIGCSTCRRSGWWARAATAFSRCSAAARCQLHRRRRSALHQPVGPRLPSGIPPARTAAERCSPASACTPTPRRPPRASAATSPRSSGCAIPSSSSDRSIGRTSSIACWRART